MKVLRGGIPLMMITTAALLSSCGSDGKGVADRTGSTQAIDTASLAPGAPATPATGAPAVDTVASQPVVTHRATISTTLGDMEVDLYGVDAPKTVKNFVGLADKKFYDGLAFHRVALGFVIQAGDPYSRDSTKRDLWGTGGESIYGGPFEDELNPNSPSGRRGYVTGTLAMANSGPNTNSSQFYIVLDTKGASHLPYNYTIFGFVRKGMDVAHKIEQTGQSAEKPVHPAFIKKVTVKELPAGTVADSSTHN